MKKLLTLVLLSLIFVSFANANDEIDIGYENTLFAWNMTFNPNLDSGIAYSTQWKAFGHMTNLPAQVFEFTRYTNLPVTVYIFSLDGEPVEIAININGFWNSMDIDDFKELKQW